jgi:pyruvate/2-oxoglutarate dehydrogenase complex dihydrolipoamide dehydrogenase (E3) component
MPIDYDLIILGGTPTARHAAVFARSFGARVGLVEPEPYEGIWAGTERLFNQALLQVGQVTQQVRRAGSFGIQVGRARGLASAEANSIKVNWEEATQWARGVVNQLNEERSPAVLSAIGIDVIWGRGSFYAKPQLNLLVNDRSLTSRAYLIAGGTYPVFPEIDGLMTAQPLTPEKVWKLKAVPASLIALGSHPHAIELAQLINRCGGQVTIITEEATLLPQEDRAASQLIQAQLEAEGVRVMTQTPVSQVKQLGDRKWVQAGTEAIEAAEILVGTRPHVCQELNLEAIQIQTDAHIQVNARLQTTHPRVFACGDAIDSFPFSSVANDEARVAVRNALFLPTAAVRYQQVPWTILTDPCLSRIGLTEAQARRRYGAKVWVLQQQLQANPKAQMRGDTTGFCKMLVHCSGEILGVHWVGKDSEEVMETIALAMQNRLKMQEIAQLPTLSPTLAELLQQTAMQWQQQQLAHQPWRRDLLETWFTWRR